MGTSQGAPRGGGKTNREVWHPARAVPGPGGPQECQEKSSQLGAPRDCDRRGTEQVRPRRKISFQLSVEAFCSPGSGLDTLF